MPETELARVIRESGLVSGDDRGLVMVSGGADSVALLSGLVEVLGSERLIALHVNYGLRAAADDDQALVERLCERLGVELVVHRAGEPEGNKQAWAREIRHREAGLIRADRDLDWIAVGHTRSDQVETFLYRLASSPGVRPLLAMPARSGEIIRPLLRVSGRYVREQAGQLRLEFAEDSSNRDPSYARNRIRLEVLPGMELVNPAVEQNIVRTRAELQEDEDALSSIARGLLREAGEDPDGGLAAGILAGQPPAVIRRLLRSIAEAALGRPVAISASLTASAIRLARDPEGGRLDLGGGDSLLIEARRITVASGGPADPVPAAVAVETGVGPTAFGDWRFEPSQATEDEARQGFGNPWVAWLDLDGQELVLRPWRAGDRIEPLGMSGSKKLQDVFTDALVPASRRLRWPVLEVNGTVVWVPGLARSRHLLIGGPDRPVLRLQARPPFDP